MFVLTRKRKDGGYMFYRARGGWFRERGKAEEFDILDAAKYVARRVAAEAIVQDNGPGTDMTAIWCNPKSEITSVKAESMENKGKSPILRDRRMKCPKCGFHGPTKRSPKGEYCSKCDAVVGATPNGSRANNHKMRQMIPVRKPQSESSVRGDDQVLIELGLGFVSGAGQDNAFFSGLGIGGNDRDPATRTMAGGTQNASGYANFLSTPDGNPRPSIVTGGGAQARGMGSQGSASVITSITPLDEEGGNEELEILQDCKDAVMSLVMAHNSCKHGQSYAQQSPTCGCTSNQNPMVRDFLRCFSELEAKINGWITEQKRKAGKVMEGSNNRFNRPANAASHENAKRTKDASGDPIDAYVKQCIDGMIDLRGGISRQNAAGQLLNRLERCCEEINASVDRA